MGVSYIEYVRERLNNTFDVKYREIKWHDNNIYIVYIESLCDSKFISEYIIAPIMTRGEEYHNVDDIKGRVIVSNSIEEAKGKEEIITSILTANAVIIFDDINRCLCCEVKGFPKRSIDIPITETVIKGPREGFSENIQDNISAIRRRIKSANLKIERVILGNESKTTVAIFYMEDKTPEELIKTVRDKINDISRNFKDEFIFDISSIEEGLRNKGTPFDTIGYTEKPDVAASKISEGRVLVMADGGSFAITAPYFFIENFQTTDDYTLNKFMANMARFLRWFSFGISTLLPGIYIALVTYHFKLVPSTFLLRMAVFRAGVPVPTVIELLYMIVFFQIIREAGVRLPQPIGPTLSIVGALILGDAAVNSGLASQVTVVVVAITSIASYLVPKVYVAIFTWNILIIIFSASLGLPGFYISFVLFVSHLASLTSCGYPYLYPLGTLRSFKYKDVIFRGDLDKISSNILSEED